MSSVFLPVVSYTLCGGLFLAELVHLHECYRPACRADKHVHEEAPRGGEQHRQVLLVRADVATTSSFVLAPLPTTRDNNDED